MPITVLISDREGRMWRRQLLFVLAVAVFSWTHASGEEVGNGNKMGRSEFPNSFSSSIDYYVNEMFPPFQ